MRISDWSSDVCSSDLVGFPQPTEGCDHSQNPAHPGKAIGLHGQREEEAGRDDGRREGPGRRPRHDLQILRLGAQRTGDDRLATPRCPAGAEMTPLPDLVGKFRHLPARFEADSKSGVEGTRWDGRTSYGGVSTLK